ncbi:MAG: hypothetical protein ACLFOY_13015 [Desulfatibacillaceae bacterium]
MTLDETDRVLDCGFCRVKLHIFSHGTLRYCMPPKTAGDDVIYLPYWRFKGTVYSCADIRIHHRLVDASQLARDISGVPFSMGLRPQVLHLRFAVRDTPGALAPPDCSGEDALKIMEERFSGLRVGAFRGESLERAYIGETASVIFAPFTRKRGKWYDAILDRSVGQCAEADEFLDTRHFNQQNWEPEFLPAMCPYCGWDLSGERDTHVFLCRNCDSAWRARGKKLARVRARIVPTKNPEALYLPFWKISPEVSGLDLDSHADLVRLANLPVAQRPEWEHREANLWTPAFKMNPKLFLRVARQITTSPPMAHTSDRLRMKQVLSANLPLSEAVEFLKVLLAEVAVPRQKIFPYLPYISVKPKSAGLVYVPFIPQGSGQELVGEGLGFAVSAKALETGQGL